MADSLVAGVRRKASTHIHAQWYLHSIIHTSNIHPQTLIYEPYKLYEPTHLTRHHTTSQSHRHLRLHHSKIPFQNPKVSAPLLVLALSSTISINSRTRRMS
jgi:hypothetical protein